MNHPFCRYKKFIDLSLIKAVFLMALLAGCVTVTLQQELDAKLIEGKTLYAKQQCDKAITIFQDILNKDPNHVGGHTWMARCLVERDNNWNDFASAFRHGRIAFDLAKSRDHPELKKYLNDLLDLGRDELTRGKTGIKYFRLFDMSQPIDYRGSLEPGRILAEHGLCEGDTLNVLARALDTGTEPKLTQFTLRDEGVLDFV